MNESSPSSEAEQHNQAFAETTHMHEASSESSSLAEAALSQLHTNTMDATLIQPQVDQTSVHADMDQIPGHAEIDQIPVHAEMDQMPVQEETTQESTEDDVAQTYSTTSPSTPAEISSTHATPPRPATPTPHAIPAGTITPSFAPLEETTTIVPAITSKLPPPPPPQTNNHRPAGVRTKQLTVEQRQRCRTLYYDAKFSYKRISEITGYTDAQVRNAVKAESAAIKPRSGRPPKRKAEDGTGTGAGVSKVTKDPPVAKKARKKSAAGFDFLTAANSLEFNEVFRDEDGS